MSFCSLIERKVSLSSLKAVEDGGLKIQTRILSNKNLYCLKYNIQTPRLVPFPLIFYRVFLSSLPIKFWLPVQTMKHWGNKGFSYKSSVGELYVSCDIYLYQSCRVLLKFVGWKQMSCRGIIWKICFHGWPIPTRNLPFTCNDMNIDRSLPETHKPLSFDLH